MALAAGNAVILKPSPETPLTALAMGRLFDGIVPPDLIQVVVGGDDQGRALVTSGVDRLVFTGSSQAGKEIMALASPQLTPLTLELGGKDPGVVMDDADLPRAADGVVWGAFVNAGQTCVCVKRVYVQDAVFDQFLTLVKERVGKLRLGYGWEDPDIDVGPMISEGAVQAAEAVVEEAVKVGGKVLVGGKRAPGLRGHFFEPTVIVDAPQACRAVQEETFGPIITVHRFASDEDAVRLANDCPYALSASVWSRNVERGRRIAERINGGTVVVNNVGYTYGLSMTPWGGKGMSGFGRTHGNLGFAELVEPHHVHVDKGRFRREFWWYPYDRESLDAGKDMMDLLYASGPFRKLSAVRRLRKIMKGR
jgi:succinate-semialdehyde dehydrogenase/glutarate-semialdehyde dehydrogenase